MALLHARPRFAGSLTSIHDADCHAPRSGAGHERLVVRHELVVVRRGVFVTHIGRCQLVSAPFQVLCVPAGSVVRFSHPEDAGDRFTALEFTDSAARELMRRYTPSLADATVCPVPTTTVPLTPELMLRFYQLRAILQAPSATTLGVETAALELLDAVLRIDHNRRGALRPTAPRESRRRRVDLVEAVQLSLAGHLGASLSLSELSRIVGTSPFHMSRTFRAALGVPIHKYHLRLRLASALDRIADGEDNLSALAHEHGFVSHSHFTRTFTAVFGESPSATRALLHRP